jgi:hypothetical protein
MPSDPFKKDLGKVLLSEYPSLGKDALNRVRTGKSLYHDNRLPPGWTPDYARLVLMTAMGLFWCLTHLPVDRFHLYERERDLLNSVVEFGNYSNAKSKDSKPPK